jgi:hypothetical protein
MITSSVMGPSQPHHSTIPYSGGGEGKLAATSLRGTCDTHIKGEFMIGLFLNHISFEDLRKGEFSNGDFCNGTCILFVE